MPHNADISHSLHKLSAQIKHVEDKETKDALKTIQHILDGLVQDTHKSYEGKTQYFQPVLRL